MRGGVRHHEAEFAAHTQAERAGFAHHARHDVGDGAAVRFFGAGDFFVGRFVRQRHHVVVDFDAADGKRQFAVEFVEFAAVKAEHRVGMAAESETQGLGGDKRIAVAVAAYPAADF